MHIRHILFDLDGTLLPMNQDEFVTFYMPLLAKKYISEGISFDPKAFIASVWKGYGAMVNNDGSCTNREAFWQYMDELLPTDSENSERIALDFYANDKDFNLTSLFSNIIHSLLFVEVTLLNPNVVN